jgi:hypothetical protein
MFYRLKYSYNKLKPTQQQCFLYCTLFFPQHGSISKKQLVDYWLAEGLLLNDCLKGDQIKLRVINLFRSHDVDHLNLDSLKAPMFLGITICVRLC